MCGRISQHQDIIDYYKGLGLPPIEIEDKVGPPRRFNVSPGTDVMAIHSLGDAIRADAIRWGYHTKWAKEKKIPPAVNATIEKAKTGYWAGLWKTGRVIVSADGWYEWTGEKGNKQPWFIKPKSGEPIYIAALTGYRPSVEGEQPHGGMALVTTESAGGMLDVHDRRPIVLTPEDAKMWIDLSWSAEQMLELVRAAALPPDAFTWYKVTRDVNKAGNQSPEMVEPLAVSE
jgi:putative SOS response-associated peptidase YedK